MWGRSEDAGIVADIPAQEDKCGWRHGSPDEAAEMADGVAWTVQEVKRSVSEKVKGSESTNCQSRLIVEAYLSQTASAAECFRREAIIRDGVYIPVVAFQNG